MSRRVDPERHPTDNRHPADAHAATEPFGHVGAVRGRPPGPDDRHRIGPGQIEKTAHPARDVQHGRRAEESAQSFWILAITRADQLQLRSIRSGPRMLGISGAELRIFAIDLIAPNLSAPRPPARGRSASGPRDRGPHPPVGARTPDIRSPAPRARCVAGTSHRPASPTPPPSGLRRRAGGGGGP